ncbi:NAD(P)/FAD-dependent oxidoreductase [Gilliamella sp. B14448G11]|uniref:NAD(P)/FAD-dependent oxidoreductase n=1 Tax=unclassified Gilliamella TaxID=2685620 RepID=UPI0018DC2592|nr:MULTISPECIES: NAD(P)/FAD-dependent oxidoreductase [unclassified Gilliamella]MBI0027891.1 NAD(P)/FAD-dependent oxidoreductase [Gilliamella sp. B14448G7]MBI0031098.1 NAD(P)/FAD-dependent oxidoreductase [Gilliamella sp. B14384G15]MBI0034473.1 NAD(P)/FAD-dependent oxidoreductase [Gilliamella sp. B14448G11]MBI0041597.1 NAD(P)/FAD-dependent oxidoreductase [Gilliamella sp. B14448G12]MBI0058448.1 NAD(P)/FAD-dependent oxidoreductase [Gilliamella sp. B14384G12]
MQKIIIIGGGAGGLELATDLGDKLGKTDKAQITLVDKNSYHLWKPLLHEVATGVLDEQVDNIYYASQGQQHNFEFTQGTFTDLDRDSKRITVINHNDESISIDYNILVIAIGSTSNDFGTPGVKEHCIFLDDQNAAIRLRETLINKFTSFCSIIDDHQSTDEDKIRIAIVGGGATGVELASELPNMVEKFGACGRNKMCSDLLDVSVIEATDRILPALPEKTAISITKTLEKQGIHVLTKTMITKAENDGFYPKDGGIIKADIMIWTAGVKAPDYLKEISGLESSRSNQLVVKPTLQTSRDDSIFVIGDCAYAMQENGHASPPTAQAAHQMAKICYENIINILNNNPLKSFKYTDNGTIISLHDTAQGVVKIAGKSEMSVKGWFALIIHRLLYRMHQASLLGIFKTIRFARASKFMYKTKSTSIFCNRN